jgi:hypothetical protein
MMIFGEASVQDEEWEIPSLFVAEFVQRNDLLGCFNDPSYRSTDPSPQAQASRDREIAGALRGYRLSSLFAQLIVKFTSYRAVFTAAQSPILQRSIHSERSPPRTMRIANFCGLV